MYNYAFGISVLADKECAVVAPCNMPCDPSHNDLSRQTSVKCNENAEPGMKHSTSQHYKHGTVLHRCHSADNVNVYCCNSTSVCLVDENDNKPNENDDKPQENGSELVKSPTLPKIVEKSPMEEKKPIESKALVPVKDHEHRVSIVTATDDGHGHGHAHGHGHTHGHGHSHSHFGDVNSRAWMVILADGFHNLVDGMAIGAAFSSSLAGGFSTAIAVAMHELPHELGDFAVLLKEGLSIQRGLMFNAISALICLIGTAFGVALGNNESFDQMIFALAAGMFLYVSLVDMLPQISSVDTSPGENMFCHLIIRCSGMLSGTGIMICVAMLETKIGDFLKALV